MSCILFASLILNTGYAVGADRYNNYYGMILKTTDGGTTWNKLTYETTQELYSVCFTG